ncbi:MAG: DUF401 family protein, partial [Deltaproteobacteria bacterium]|nr:DUF401 family protein [Deltaproteobacteria bacterium]
GEAQRRRWTFYEVIKVTGTMSATFAIIIILATIILLIRLHVSLSIALLGSAALLGFLLGLSLPQIGISFINGAIAEETLLLLAAVLLILFFSALMKETGNMSRAITALQNIFRDDRATVAIIPAVIGILPIVGGAMLSAPLVEEASDALKLSPERRTFLNYWFRHVWEYTLPTYPGVILSATIMAVPVAKISLTNLPLTLAAIAVGIFLGFRAVRPSSTESGPLKPPHFIRSLASFLGNLSPFFFVLLLTLYFRIHLAYCLAVAAVGVALYYRLSGSVLKRLAITSFSWEIVFLILGVMIFKEILMASGSMTSMAKEFTRIGLPPVIVIISLPFILGIITGYSNAMVGISLPILLPFFQASGNGLAYLMLAYGSGFCGSLLSPVHVCLIMTQEYFHADLNRIFRMLFLPVAIVFFTGVGTLLFYLWF